MLFHKNHFLLLLTICVILASCTSNKKHQVASIQKSNFVKEDFDAFFKQFRVDSVFQKSRTQFPLMVTIAGGEGETDTNKSVQKSQAHFIGLFSSNENKKIIKKIPVNSNKIEIEYQVDDTGIEIVFYFIRKDNKWYLFSVVDNSD